MLDLVKLPRISFPSAHRKLGMSRGILVRKVVKKNFSGPSILFSSLANATAADDVAEVRGNGAAVNATSVIGEGLERVALFSRFADDVRCVLGDPELGMALLPPRER